MVSLNRKNCPTHLISYRPNEPSGIVKHLSMRLLHAASFQKTNKGGLNKETKSLCIYTTSRTEVNGCSRQCIHITI